MTWSAKYPRVREVLKAYDDGGIDGLKAYYFDDPGMVIPINSWHDRVARAITDGHRISLECELNLAIEKLKYNHERYEGRVTGGSEVEGNE